MKGKTSLILTIILILSAAACSSAAGGTEDNHTTALSETYENALTIPTQLLVGTFELEGTDLFVGSDQAESLLPLWKAYRSLLQSDTTADVETTAIINQIQEGMTTEQIEAIAAMQLTQEDVFPLVQELGFLPEGALSERGSGFSPGGGGFGGNFPGGGPPAGSPGGGSGGGQGGFGQDLSPEQIATLQARRAEGGDRGDRMNLFLIPPLIELLESKSE